MSQVAEQLEKALAYLGRRGWTKGTLVDPDTRAVCAVGAISLGGGGACGSVRARKAFAEANGLGPSPSGEFDQIPRWNDDLKTSYEDVVLGFKKAIRYAEENDL
jgi:hypothetical protein